MTRSWRIFQAETCFNTFQHVSTCFRSCERDSQLLPLERAALQAGERHIGKRLQVAMYRAELGTCGIF